MKEISKNYLTIDLGASSGRVIIATIGKQLTQKEIYRFKNQPQKDGKFLIWDFEYIINEIYKALEKAFQIEPNIESIGIDTWGCDYGYIDNAGNLIRNPICYRDERTFESELITKKYFSKDELYKETGIQHLRFNTIYQLAYDSTYEKALLEKATNMLMIPDLIAYFLTGEKRIELTNLSTTSFYNPNKKEIVPYLKSLGFKDSLIPKLIYPSETYGVLKESLVQKYHLKPVPVVAVCTHDTASAINSLNVNENDVYISSGTWSLIGKLLDKPLINNQTFKFSYTNEVGYQHQIRFLKNISGFWIKNLIVDAFQFEHISYSELDQLILDNLDFDTIIDLDHTDFELKDDILKKIKNYCVKTNQRVPEKPGEYLAVFNYSLVSKYKHHLDTLEQLTNIKTKQLIIIGGGSQNDLINQMTADITGIQVIKGEKEATSIGNALVQHHSNYPNLSIEEVRAKALNPSRVVFKPKSNLSSIYEKYKKLIQGETS